MKRKTKKEVKDFNYYLKKAGKWLTSTTGILTVITILVLISAILAGSSEYAMAATVIAGIENGKHVVGGPLTTDIVRDRKSVV